VILDTSALMAILRQEEEAGVFTRITDDADIVRLSAANYLEASIVIDGTRDPVLRLMLDDFLEDFRIQIEPVTVEQAHIASQAFRSFGKGMNPAGLNFGDCFTYALAKEKREPLLFKGNDFSRTDLIPAWEPGRPS
jgi:ribonuclease VapC